MRVAVVGPTHPLKGRVAAHTTELAHRLTAAGHDVDLVSWAALYPARLYPHKQSGPGSVPEVMPFSSARHPLSWFRPDSWLRVGRSLRTHDLVIVIQTAPAMAAAHIALLRAAGSGPRTVIIAHNVLLSGPQAGAAALVRMLLARADQVIVHSPDQSALATSLRVKQVVTRPLPPHLPGGLMPISRTRPTPKPGEPVRLLSLGIVRPYKGIDLLVRALRRAPHATLTIAGELWGMSGTLVRDLAADPALAGRVQLRSDYIPATQLPALLAQHDVLALPYRAATASRQVHLGFAHGLPVLATRTGTFASDVTDGVDGVLAEADDLPSLMAAMDRLTQPGMLAHLQAGVNVPDLEQPWRHYLSALLDLNSASGNPTAIA